MKRIYDIMTQVPGVTARVTLGPQACCDGDGAVAAICLRISAGANSEIPAELQFGNRVYVAGEGLVAQWGDAEPVPAENRYRCRTMPPVYAPTAGRAILRAVSAINAAVKPLADAVAERRARQAVIWDDLSAAVSDAGAEAVDG